MISGIDSSAVALSGNLSVLKKAMDSEEAIMSSILSGMEGAQGNLQTQQAPSQPTQAPSQSNNLLDIMA
ncbi:hypothetical protein [Helicobacter winghamensis]|uniref:Motility protein n=1 Tax=Helicobacter winghamensis TaxID=157268 RepID=A0A2N3PHN5_9HELI|nr:hypothetical protein [Helicobacter winghamensis]EEO25509.1 hypothetical protein HWAG_00301 [Helicobacter winghamensis ATCC BAA-430]PKT78069.1 hypothetical protein BCM34_02345 [Helicobacter winghamensis]PKT78334.1 hypothetical protein BCM32_01100 [Helicobacter winghamensis]PKT78597.1 hypothetical protein BCM35_00635 [Helicobacter winghamensis]PKT80074.1 hypothetical protein BCM31_00040 [Helicobacter winghamensis]